MPLTLLCERRIRSLIDKEVSVLQLSFKYDEWPTAALLRHYDGAAHERLR